MRHPHRSAYAIAVLIPLFAVIANSSHAQTVTLPDIDTSGSPNGIVPFPAGTPSVFTDTFSKYTKVNTPNGKPIHFIVQDAWSDDQILKARNIMEQILTDYPGAIFGDNKAVVANSMSDKKATMTLFNSSATARQWRRQATYLYVPAKSYD